jgi:hypothetical protein
MATSAIWNTTYRAPETTLAPILMSFSRKVVSDLCLTPLGRARLDATASQQTAYAMSVCAAKNFAQNASLM